MGNKPSSKTWEGLPRTLELGSGLDHIHVGWGAGASFLVSWVNFPSRRHGPSSLNGLVELPGRCSGLESICLSPQVWSSVIWPAVSAPSCSLHKLFGGELTCHPLLSHFSQATSACSS